MKSFFLLMALSCSAIASECPWVKLRGADMMSFDSDLSVVKQLSKEEVQADLNCLKILFENYYVAQKIYGETKLLSRLEKEIRDSKAVSNKSLMKKMFALHTGMPDLHLSYSLEDQELRFQLSNKKSVQLSEDLGHDVVYDKGSAFYFRPGSLINLSPEQKAFIELVGKVDKNLILDLRGNQGGSDEFAYALTEAIFTANQKIPITKRHQVQSLLQQIGFSLTALILGYEGVQSYREQIRDEVAGLPFNELLSYQMNEETETLKGKRHTPFKSKITLIIDGGCASSCETIVEKLSDHPNATVVGSNTTGALHFSNAMTFMLPHSGIVVRLPTLLHTYENDAAEGVGYRPDQDATNIDLASLL